MKASNERILAIAARIKDNWTLCSLCENMGDAACEKEVMIAQTMKACEVNHEQRGDCFSFDECDRGFHNGGIVDNGTAYSYLFDEGYFIEGEFEDKPTIVPSIKLCELLESHLNMKAVA